MIYRVIFVSNDRTYDVFCKQVYQSDLAGFMEIEDIIFQTGGVLANPAEEKLRKEFEGVRRSFVPIYNLIRIDEVEKSGVSKVLEQKNSRVAVFPTSGGQQFTK